MNDPILSLRAWSYYVLGLGLALFSIPNVIFDIFGIATTDEVWIRVAGLVVVALGIMYAAGARAGHVGAVRASVNARAVAVIGLVGLWITGGPWQLILFAAVDLLGTAWSWSALRSASS